MTVNMLTISALAKQFNLSRSTILYYEGKGLLHPDHISENGYRWYGDHEIKRLETIISYRTYGLPIANIIALLEPSNISQFEILENHFKGLEAEVKKLRSQQRIIIELFKTSIILKEKHMNKARWVEIMTAAGFTQTDMLKWHQKFEQMEPEEHQKFLESLGIDPEEIAKIRAL